MIVITAPTGNIGRQVLARILATDERVRVVARHPSKLSPHIRERVEVIEGSHGDRNVMMKALDGAESVFWLVAGDPQANNPEAAFVDFARPAAEAIKHHGIKRIVSISALGRGWPKRAGYITATLQMDDMLADTGASYRALAVGCLMENVLRQIHAIRTAGVFSWPSPGDLKLPNVASQDVAAISAALLLDRSWRGHDSIPMAGPQNLSFRDMAETMSDVLGKMVTYREIPMEDMRAMMIARGASPGMAQGTIEILTAYNEGMYETAGKSSLYETPTTFRTWCETVLKDAVLA